RLSFHPGKIASDPREIFAIGSGGLHNRSTATWRAPRILDRPRLKRLAFTKLDQGELGHDHLALVPSNRAVLFSQRYTGLRNPSPVEFSYASGWMESVLCWPSVV